MGNKITIRKHPLCSQCHNPLPLTSLTSWKRKQYIEGSEYTVYHVTFEQKYFEPVSKEAKAKVQYYCFKCMFRLILDPFQCPKELRNVDEEESLTFENMLVTETYQNINAAHQRTVASFKNNFSDLHFQDTVCECRNLKIDKQFYESLVKRLWVERKTLENEVLDTLQKKLSSSKKPSVDLVLGSLFKKYLQNTQSGKHALLENFDELFYRYADPKFLHSLREQINSYFRTDKDWLVSILLDLYVHFSYKITGPIAQISNHVCDVVVAWTGYLPSRDELSSFILCLISICARVGTHEVSSLENLSRDHFQDTLFQSSRHENAKWVRHCSNDHIRKKISTSVLSEYSEFLCNIFQSHPWSMDKFDQLLYIFQQRFKFDKPYLKECLEILQYHGLSNINFVLKCIEECPVKQVSSMLKQVALSSKNLPVHHLLTEFNIINNVNEALIEKCKLALESIKMTIINFQHYPHHAECDDSERVRLFFESQFQDIRSFNVEECKKMYFLASAACAVFKVKKYKPRDVQLLSAILYLLYEEKSGLLLQIHTGEGKSCIIAMIAATLVLVNRDTDKTVDIITSSDLLATRDFNDWKDFFKFLDITSSQNVNVVGESKCYCNKIVFGTVETFSADYLRHDFQQTHIRGKRQFDVAIVDEVDSILLDKGIQFTYLTQMVAVMKHLEPILAMIWYHASEIEQIYSTENEMFFQGSPLPFNAFISNILAETLPDESSVHDYVKKLLGIAENKDVIPTGFSEKYDLAVKSEPLKVKELLSLYNNSIDVGKFLKLCEGHLKVKFQMFEIYRKNNVCVRVSPNEPSDSAIPTLNVLSLNNGYVCDLHRDNFKDVCSMIETKVNNQIVFSKRERDHNGIISKVPIPLHLEYHVKTQMKTWIYNAFEAKKMQPDREYLVKENAIHPIDFKHTGLIESNKKWGDGLQQFLEMKHFLALSPMTLITNFLSNVALFKKYGRIYGLSGTLGSKIDEEFIKVVYAICCFRIPTHKPNKMIDLGGVLKHSREEWLLEICDTIRRECKPENGHCSRAALVIAEDILTAKLLKSEIESIPKTNLELYTRSETDENDVIKKSLQQGDVIVATNLAGRGTNITVSDKVNENGGLFVLVTFLPFNERVEFQAKGRTSRKGEPGSTKMVIFSQTLENNLSSSHNFAHAMQLRDESERKTMMFMKKEVELVLLKDNLFQTYCETINDLRPEHARNEDNIQILHEKWGFWLKHKSSCIENQPDCNIWKERLKKYLRDVQSELVNGKIKAVQKEVLNEKSRWGSIYNTIRLGNSNFVNKEYEIAKTYFTRAIETDEIWSAFAYYNRAFCTLQVSKKAGKKYAIADLNKALSLLQYYFNELTVTMACIQSSRVTMEEVKKGEGNLKKQIESKFQVLNFCVEKIKESVKNLEEIDKLNLNTVVHGNDIFAASSELQDILCHEYLFEVWQLGLTQIFAVNKRPRITLEQVIVIAIGALQVSLGAILIPLSAGFLSNIAFGLVGAGVSDIVEGSLAMVRGKEFLWKSWGMKKVFTLLVICLTPCVMKYGKIGCKALWASKGKVNLMKVALTEVKEAVVTDATSIAISTNTKTVIQQTVNTYGGTSKAVVTKAIKVSVTNVFSYFVKTCCKFVVEDVVMDKCVELTRKSLQDHIDPAMESLIADGEMKMLIIRMKIYSKTQEKDMSTCSQDCISFENIGMEVLSYHLEANKKQLQWHNKIIEVLLSLVDPLVSILPDNFKPVRDVLDICKEAKKSGGTMLHAGCSAWSIKDMISETSEVFKKGILKKFETMKIPHYEENVNHLLQHDKQLKDDLAKLAAHFSKMICDSYADLFQQFVTKKCYDHVVSKVKSCLSKQTNTKPPFQPPKKKEIEFGANKLKQFSARFLTDSDGGELIVETDNRIDTKELEKAKQSAIKHKIDLHILTDDGTGKLSETFQMKCNSEESKTLYILYERGQYSSITGETWSEKSLCDIIELARNPANENCAEQRKQKPDTGDLQAKQHVPFKRQTITMKLVAMETMST